MKRPRNKKHSWRFMRRTGVGVILHIYKDGSGWGVQIGEDITGNFNSSWKQLGSLGDLKAVRDKLTQFINYIERRRLGL